MMGKVDASKITKTQFLTIAMVLILIFYSVPLLWHVAKINDCFDRHGNLLLAQKEQHRQAMARREGERAESKAAKAAAAAPTGAGDQLPATAATAATTATATTATTDAVAEASSVDTPAEKEDETVVVG